MSVTSVNGKRYTRALSDQVKKDVIVSRVVYVDSNDILLSSGRSIREAAEDCTLLCLKEDPDEKDEYIMVIKP